MLNIGKKPVSKSISYMCCSRMNYVVLFEKGRTTASRGNLNTSDSEQSTVRERWNRYRASGWKGYIIGNYYSSQINNLLSRFFKLNWFTFCIMGRQLNFNSELKFIDVSVLEAIKVIKIRPETNVI